MKIAVIAAGGKSGKAFVVSALAAGHHVTAGVHHITNLPSHPNLSVQVCDASKPDDVRKLLANQDAVISFIGHVRGAAPNIQSVATANLIKVMGNIKMRRIISLTGTGVRLPGDSISFMDRLLNASIGLIDPKRIHDSIQHVELLKNSELDWTLIRVLKLTNGAEQLFSLDEHGPVQWLTSRKTVAKATLQVLEQRTFIKQAPMITRAK
jgi:putative NADH-flavin reductase